ncbi:calcium-binding protein [Mesorhizobium sp. CAU 1732]|uniref:calcium-binding protein n=1 Tax=Mesorhizobium sp. CAU 1732 TaxID=3140358 RepID=UPI0032603167
MVTAIKIAQGRAGNPIDILQTVYDIPGQSITSISSTRIVWGQTSNNIYTRDRIVIEGEGLGYNVFTGQFTGTITSVSVYPPIQIIGQEPPLVITDINQPVGPIAAALSDGNEAALMALLSSRGYDWGGSSGNDSFTGGAQPDVLRGNAGNDLLNGGAGNDYMAGGAGDDIYIVGAVGDETVELSSGGTDTVRSYLNWTLSDHIERLELLGSAVNGTGNALNNTIVGNALNNVLNGAGGDDYMVGGAGDDTYIVAAVGDKTIEAAGGGTDTVRAYINWTLAANVERLELLGSAQNGTGNALNNTLVGNSLVNVLSGGDGNDYIRAGAGNDVLNGGNGNDTLVGGAGADRLVGGAGHDTFVYEALADSRVGPTLRDTIEGFVHGQDKIGLSALDANAGAAGNQAFTFIGSAGFSGVAGQLRYSAYGNTVIVDADVNGDRVSDFQIAVTGTNFMAGTDFIL